MIYDLVAPIYDKINEDVDYCKWADFIEEIIVKNYKMGRPELVLDLGCGTGKMTFELAKRGYDMTGIDYSCEMLNIAREKSEELGFNSKILWLLQDMCEFELYGTVDVTVSCLDCLNHLTNTKDFKKCLSLVHNYLIPDGLFIFDINGKYKFENIYGNETYVSEDDSSFCVWQNFYNKNTKICDFYITLFENTSKNNYVRTDEIQKERMYTLRSIKNMLKSENFEFIGAYSDFNFKNATDDDKRIYIVARCKK